MVFILSILRTQVIVKQTLHYNIRQPRLFVSIALVECGSLNAQCILYMKLYHIYNSVCPSLVDYFILITSYLFSTLPALYSGLLRSHHTRPHILLTQLASSVTTHSEGWCTKRHRATTSCWLSFYFERLQDIAPVVCFIA